MGKKLGRSKGDRMSEEWEKLLSSQMIFQDKFPECVLVGGTAASLHAGHRVSIDADHVVPDLKKRFAEILARVEAEAGRKTARMEPPVLILGHFMGVRTGIRQLLRSKPLETNVVHGLRIPTPQEVLRIKAALIVRRNATRDFIDFVALSDHLGLEKSLKALETLDELYPQNEKGAVTKQLAMQLAEPKPWDLSDTDLSNYKGLKEPYTHWQEIVRRAGVIAQRLIQQG